EYLGGGKDPWGNERIGFFAKTSLNRRDFGLNWNQVLETGGVVVSEQVEVALDVQAVKAQAIGQAACGVARTPQLARGRIGDVDGTEGTAGTRSTVGSTRTTPSRFRTTTTRSSWASGHCG